MQKLLSKDQIENFYHDDFVKSQVEDFITLLGTSFSPSLERVVDIGGGCGFFVKALQNRLNLNVSVLDSDVKSIEKCKQEGIDAICQDALSPNIVGDEYIVCFNLILHHLVGASEQKTLNMQKHALSIWHPTVHAIFINEYIYESFIFSNVSGWLIYQITSNSVLSYLCKFVAKLIPSLKANTFGVGVRFRSHEEWCTVFTSLGFEIVETKLGKEEYVSLPRRLLLIKNCRRDSFFLKPIFP